jgi:predicted DNA-binding protein
VLYNAFVSPSAKKQTAFRIDPEIIERLRAIKERDGIPVSEQVRRALTVWIEAKGDLKTGRLRAATRKRP